jgi:hypothetical protein
MSWTTHFDPLARRGTLTADGPIDLGGSLEALLALATAPELAPGFTILVDLTAATYTPTLADAARLGSLQQHAEALAGRRVAFLSATPTLQALAGLVASMATARSIPAKAFTEAEAAAAARWLADGS